jgi:hypothetical protein
MEGGELFKTAQMGVFHQLGSGLPVNPFAKSELLY